MRWALGDFTVEVWGFCNLVAVVMVVVVVVVVIIIIIIIGAVAVAVPATAVAAEEVVIHGVAINPKPFITECLGAESPIHPFIRSRQ